MFTFLLILLGIYIVYRVLRPRSRDNQNQSMSGGYGGPGMGGMFGGMILGYLLTHYLIDRDQYEMWRNLDDGQLRDELISNGILNEDDYANLAGQARSGNFAYDDSDSDWTNGNNSSSDTADFDNFDDYSDGGFGGDDFGGFDQ